ncbi:MAG: HAD family hydrolase [Myxococcota bacterium]
MAIEVVLFDLGGVLIELGGMGDMAVFSSGDSEDEIWRRWLSCPWVRRFERGECDAQAFAEGMVETWSMPVSADAFLEAFIAWPKGMLPGAHEVVRSAGQNARVACLSNTNVLHVERQWAEFGIYELFDGIYLSNEMGIVKPDAEAFHHVVDGLGVSADQVLFIDDNQINVDGARAAGLIAEKAVGPDAAHRIISAHLSPRN